MIMGLNSATADYACLWCKVHKHNRWDRRKGLNLYDEEGQKRTLEEIEDLFHKKSNNFSCIHTPD